jgi:8-oxo-dGTP pyrophosphatase MutT (NUDIX family)
MKKAIKYAVAFVIYNQDRTKFLIVQRPADDEDLPNVWGLPAGSIKGDETFEECLIRSGREKLGVELRPARFIGKGEMEREKYILHLELFEAEIVKGVPKVPQPVKGITQYQKWRWGKSLDLKEAVEKGSLCSKIYLESIGEKIKS